jgi:primosomal replication protein N
MTEKVFQNNQAVVAGEVVSDFVFSHELYGEGFYNVDLKVDRLSDTYDVIPVMISERIINVKESYVGRRLEVKGQFRSYNKHEDFKNRLILSLFAREVREMDDEEVYDKPNQIYLDGFICKKPIYRMTPLGREIADILLAVNRAYGKSDYIPCICWGRNARYAGNLDVGAHIQLWGRIQSRQYQKKIGDDQVINRVAYEISVSKIECSEEE